MKVNVLRRKIIKKFFAELFFKKATAFFCFEKVLDSGPSPA